MSVSELRAKFGAAPPPLHQNAAAAAAVVAGTSEHASQWSSSFKGAPASAAAGAANRQSSGGAFGVVLKPALQHRPGINIDANGNDSEPGAVAVAAEGGRTSSARPVSQAVSKSAAAAAVPAAPDAVAAGKPREGVAPVVASAGASAAAKPTTSPGFGKPAPAGVKPSTLVAAAAGTAGKPAITGRPVGLGISRPNAAADATVEPGAAGNQTNHSPPAASSGDSLLSPSVAQAAAAIRAKLSPPVTSPTKERPSSTSLKSTTSGASPSAAAAAVGSGESKGSGGGSPAFEAARSHLRKVQQPGGGVAGRGVTFPKSPVAAEALGAAAAVAHAGTAAQAQGDVANVVVFDSSGARFQCLPFVTPHAAAPPKPDSEAGGSIDLPVVAWPEDSKLPAAAESSSPVGNRSLSLIVPTTEEEEVEYDDASSGSGSFRVPAPPMPPRLVTGRPEATARARSETESAAPEETESTYDEGFSAANDEETFEEYDDIAMAPQLPARNGLLLAKSDPKEAQRRQKEEEKRQKAKEKEEKEQRAKEKKEKEKREKEEQKREAELQKLLASFKVSAADQPQCEATVKAELLKPGKNELQVKAGERLFILAKDARGKWLAKSSSGAIGTISASNVTVIETGSSAADNGDEEYADVEEVYSVLDD